MRVSRWMEAHGRMRWWTMQRCRSLSQWDAVRFENLFVVAVLKETHDEGIFRDCSYLGIVELEEAKVITCFIKVVTVELTPPSSQYLERHRSPTFQFGRPDVAVCCIVG